MRVLAVHADAIVVVSDIWQTTCTAVRSGDEGFVIDSPILPNELDALPGLLEEARFPVSGLLCTHADWDHLLARLAFPQASLGAGESSTVRLQAELGNAQRDLRAFDEEHYVQRAQPLALAGLQALPVPGHLALGPASELELHAANGHTVDGTAYWIPWLQMLVIGDYLSPVEIPMISPGGSITAYLATLERLAPLVQQARTVIPGHGGPLSREQARRLLEQDVDYLSALPRCGAATPLPGGRTTSEQKRIHAENVGTLAPG